jgi:hypothetical protein
MQKHRRHQKPQTREVEIPAGVVKGAADLEVKEVSGRMKVRKRTVCLSREAITSVFEFWLSEHTKGRTDLLPPVGLTPLPIAGHGDRCAQEFLRLAAQLWPADEALQALNKEVPPRVVTPSVAQPVVTPRQESSLWQRIKSKFA